MYILKRLLYRFFIAFCVIFILGLLLDSQSEATCDPTLLGSIGGTGAVHGIHTVAGYAYTVGTNGLEIIDVSNPTALEQIGFLRLPASSENLYVSGTTAYVASGSYLQIVDVADPASPQLLASYETPGGVGDVYVSGTTAYVAAGSYLQILDVTNPASPQLLGEYSIPSGFNLYVSGNTAYVANGAFGLRVIDVSNPKLPKLLKTYHTPGAATDVYVSGTTAYVAAGSYLQILDVTNPASPQLLTSYETPGGVDDVYVSGTTAYVEHGFYIINWNFSTHPRGLDVIDVTNPASPQLLGSYGTPSDVYGIYVSGSTAYVAGVFGLHVIDVTKPASPQLLATYYGLGSSTDVCISGTTAYVVTGPYPDLQIPYMTNDGLIALYPRKESGYLQIIDVADPVSPQFLASCLSNVVDAYVSGNTVYAAGDFGLQIIDVSNPASPDLLGNCNTPGFGTEVYVSGTTAYMATAAYLDGTFAMHNPGLDVIDVTNPASPQLLGSYETPSDVYDIYVSGSTAYLAGVFGLDVIDVTNPASPQLLGSYETPSDVYGIYVSGTTAYVAAGSYLQIVDVTNPASPQLLGSYDRLYDAAGLYVSGDIAYVADVASDLQIIDVGNSRNTDGDVAPLGNRDGTVNVGDALVALRFALGLETPTQEDISHGDVAPVDSENKPNPDGVINVGDALVILRKALGIISF